MFKKLSSKVALASVGVMAVVGNAMAVGPTVDYSGVGSSMSTEIGLAITAGVVVAAIKLAPQAGWSVFKSFARR
jgi:hypothetical protein